MNIKIVNKVDLRLPSRDKQIEEISFEDIVGLDEKNHDLIVYLHETDKLKILKDRYDGFYNVNDIITEKELHAMVGRSLTGYLAIEAIRIDKYNKSIITNKYFEKEVREIARKYNKPIITTNLLGDVFIIGNITWGNK